MEPGHSQNERSAGRSGQSLADFIAERARQLGFHRVGVIPVTPPRRYDAYRAWLDAGMHGTMAYMAAPEHVAGRRDVRELAKNPRTLVVVALAYPKSGGDADSKDSAGPSPIRGFVARYARGKDYHTVMKKRLYALAEAVSERIGRPVAARPCVDTAPVLERDLAEAAGVGFTAKNTMLIAPGLGSYFLLGELLLDINLDPGTNAEPEPEPDAAAARSERIRSRCGSCRACLDACPTNAFPEAYILDARRCVSYLTIEHKGPIPRPLRQPMGAMIFGCDICQDVCPFNAQAPDRTPADPELAPASLDRGAPDLIGLLELGANQRRRYLDGTAMRRANREQLLRNVCVALGNAGDPRAVAPLASKLRDRSPVVRSHAAWALGELGAIGPCQDALASEDDPAVRHELQAAIERAKLQTAGEEPGDSNGSRPS